MNVIKVKAHDKLSRITLNTPPDLLNAENIASVRSIFPGDSEKWLHH